MLFCLNAFYIFFNNKIANNYLLGVEVLLLLILAPSFLGGEGILEVDPLEGEGDGILEPLEDGEGVCLRPEGGLFIF